MPDLRFDLPEPTPWYRWIGPWPFRPLPVMLLGAYFFLVTTTGQLIGMGSTDVGQWFRNGVLFGLPAALVIGLILALGRRWQRRNGVHPVAYVLFIFVAAFLGVAARVLSGAIPLDQFARASTLALAVFRVMLMIFLINAVASAMVVRLQQQVNATQRALNLVRDQQVIMVEADEAARRQVATLLHDRVQAGLIAACLELQMVAQRCAPGDGSALRDVINRLEEMRALDVRRAARALSPSLEDVDLKTALEELAAQYEPSIDTLVHVDPSIDDRHDAIDQELLIATYRIVEQGLLNAATHGQAQHVWIDVRNDRGRFTVTVRDDGSGLATASPSTGLGLAIVETWSRVLSGSWALKPHSSGGAELRAELGAPTVGIGRHTTSQL